METGLSELKELFELKDQVPEAPSSLTALLPLPGCWPFYEADSPDSCIF